MRKKTVSKRKRPPSSVSVAWLLAELAGMTFPTQGGAYDYIRRRIEEP